MDLWDTEKDLYKKHDALLLSVCLVQPLLETVLGYPGSSSPLAACETPPAVTLGIPSPSDSKRILVYQLFGQRPPPALSKLGPVLSNPDMYCLSKCVIHVCKSTLCSHKSVALIHGWPDSCLTGHVPIQIPYLETRIRHPWYMDILIYGYMDAIVCP